jgi:alpha-N-acetylglucosaminidase
LLNTVYSGAAGHGGTASIIVGRPTTDMKVDWRVNTYMNYDPLQLVKAWGLFIKSADKLKESDGFRYDLVDITRQVLGNYANTIQPKIIKAWQQKDTTAFKHYSTEFLQLMDDMDELLGTRKDFLLGKWISDARANGITPQEKDLYEFNARDLITLWGGRDNPLHEYSNRQWSGLIKGFYKPRWEMFFAGLSKSMENNTPFDNDAFQNKVKDWEWAWVHKHDSYTDKVKGNPVEVAEKMFKKYDRKIVEAYQ